MCTAVNMRVSDLFGRTLDLERGFGEEVVVAPSEFSFGHFRTKYSIIGVAAVRNNTPLYFDGMNEAGLCAAALNFPKFAFYNKKKADLLNLPSYLILPYILGNCANVDEAWELLRRVNVTDTPFSEELPPSPLHWIISDGNSSICAEPEESRLILHHDRFDVLTNAPSFDYHSIRISDFMGMSAHDPTNRICPRISLDYYSRGLGAMGLPGDFSSCSRFVRAAFALNNTNPSTDTISDFFHIMETVSLPNGVVIAENGKAVRTVYTTCADRKTLTYYFTTYGCRRIRGVRLVATKKLMHFPMTDSEDIAMLN